jgi:hypothetical protein
MQIRIHVTPNSYGMYAPDQTYSDSTVLVAPVSHRHVHQPYEVNHTIQKKKKTQSLKPAYNPTLWSSNRQTKRKMQDAKYGEHITCDGHC